jgi:hypothetical protein
MNKTIPIALSVFIASQSIFAQLNGYLSKPGPRNADEYSYVWLHVVRPNEPRSNTWFGLHVNTGFVVKVMDSCKYAIKYPVMPLTVHLSMVDEDIKIDAPVTGTHYYFKVNVPADYASNKNAKYGLVQVPGIDGKNLFDTSALWNFTLQYPQAMDVDLPGAKNDIMSFLAPEFKKDTLHYYNIAFTPPAWGLQNVLVNPNVGYIYDYANLPLSKTYSEYLKIAPAEETKLSNEGDFKNYISRLFKNGKELDSKKIKLVSFDSIPVSVSGAWAAAFYSVRNDYATPVKQHADFLEMREIRIVFCAADANGKTILWQVEYSIRGAEKELWSKEDMEERMKSFVKYLRVVKS